MNYRFINRPQPVPAGYYQAASDHLAKTMSRVKGLKSIYRFGNITTPGISDLDILLVFENDTVCTLNGFENMPLQYRSVFTHGIMAMSALHYQKNQRLTLWSRQELLWGENTVTDQLRSREEDKALHIQTAVEFLVANYIDLKVQQAYGVFKLRSLLQHMKGIAYDLQYLGVESSPLHPLLNRLKQYIQDWFTHTPTDEELNQWLKKWIPLYDELCNDLLRQYPLYLPLRSHYRVAANQDIYPAAQVQISRKGLVLPALISRAFKKYFNLQNKLNHFRAGIPLTSVPAHPVLAERFEFLAAMKEYNRSFLPQFMTMTTSITSKLI